MTETFTIWRGEVVTLDDATKAMSEVDVMVIGGETHTPLTISQMDPRELDDLLDITPCHGCLLYPCGPLNAARCQGATLFDSVGE